MYYIYIYIVLACIKKCLFSSNYDTLCTYVLSSTVYKYCNIEVRSSCVMHQIFEAAILGSN